VNEPIPYWSYAAHLATRRAEVLARLEAVLTSGRLILGPWVERFEQHFAQACGAAHGIGVNSATDALFLALKSFAIGPGDEVVTVSNTAVPTVAAIRATGATPVFADIQPGHLPHGSRACSRLLHRAHPRLLPVHLFGQMADLRALRALADARGIPLLEDCAQATGAAQDGRRAGCVGDAAAFSFYPTKPLGGYGDGGMILTSDPDRAARLRRLRFYGMERTYYAREEGYNSRLDELHAAVLDLLLPELDARNAQRRARAAQYDQELAGLPGVHTPAVAPGNTHVYYVYTIRTTQRDALQAHLARCGIGAQVNYPTPDPPDGRLRLPRPAARRPAPHRAGGRRDPVPAHVSRTHRGTGRARRRDDPRLCDSGRNRSVNEREYQRMFEAEDRHWWYLTLRELVDGYARREFERRGPLRLFDAGCGTGGLLARLARWGEAEGCDRAPAALAACARRGLTGVHAADLSDLTLPPARYDLITVLDVLYHRWITDEGALLRRLWAGLRPGGLLLVNEVAFESLRSPHDVAVMTRTVTDARNCRAS
jgi:aminotransferase EvaB